MGYVYRRWWYFQLSSILMMNLVAANFEIQKQALASISSGNLEEIDHECWEFCSMMLIEMKKLKVANTVAGFWNFMMFLQKSNRPRHYNIFINLAQDFWSMYVDCALSRAHGMGRRQLTSPKVYFNISTKDSKKIGSYKTLVLGAWGRRLLKHQTG
ncbi:protein FAM237B [Antechinus flavipes]|uniref:protein FAM237B n=1 Tax=Antechinus flavipes TaxID=38775 RepID=UPI002235F9B6|nr:protein FAM237B [Antechinus flavipes]